MYLYNQMHSIQLFPFRNVIHLFLLVQQELDLP